MCGGREGRKLDAIGALQVVQRDQSLKAPLPQDPLPPAPREGCFSGAPVRTPDYYCSAPWGLRCRLVALEWQEAGARLDRVQASGE